MKHNCYHSSHNRSTMLKMAIGRLLILLICTRVPSVYSRDITAFTTREGDLNHVIIHNATGKIYVGAVNGIFQLSNDMQYEYEYITGPQLENVKCLPEQSCNYFPASQNNVNKILLIDYVKELLLACGSAVQGTCTIHNIDVINPIIDRVYSVSNIDNDFVATEGSVVAFFGPAPSQNNDESLGLYVGASHQTERPEAYITQKAVSTRKLHLTNGLFNFQYAYYLPMDDVKIHSYIDFLPEYAETYKVKYIHGFSYDGFSYFLTVQRSSLSSNNYETRIVRICQNDIGYYSYTEMPLKCRNANSTKTFNILQAAYVGTVGTDLGNYLKITPNDFNKDVILGVFAESANSTTDVPSDSSAVCAFTMKEISKRFMKELQKCFDGQGNQGLRFFTDEAPCMSSSIIVDLYFCGSASTSPIEVYRSYNNVDLLQGGGKGVSLTSINAMPYDHRTVAFMGTQSGQLLHYILRPINDGDNPPPMGSAAPGPVEAYRNQTMEPVGPILQDMPYSLDMQDIFVMTPQTLFRVPIHDCYQYKTCSTCVTTEDPVVCGWCGSYCSTNDNCTGSGIVWSQSACTPAIYKISPLSGPLEGGTQLTITGDNLGVGIIMSGGTHSIHLPGGALCEPLPALSDLHTIVCITGDVEDATNGIISVNINVASDLLPYIITGIATSTDQFSYVDPVISSFYPSYGPMSGGTILTVYGTDMATGNSQEIIIAGLSCVITSVKSDKITCVTAPTQDILELSSEVSVIFDSTATRYSLLQYYYVDDPVIFDIQPKTSFLSGGLVLNVTGSNLHIILEPILVVTVYVGQNEFNYNSVCTPSMNGSLIQCQAPDISSSRVETPANVTLTFVLDGADGMVQSENSTMNETTEFSGFEITYYTNPIYYEFADEDGVRELKDHTYPLEIMGNHLTLASTLNDVQVRVDNSPCNVTELTYTLLRCNPPESSQLAGNNDDDELDVLVTVGNLEYNIGKLQYVNTIDTSPEFWHYILIAVSSFIVILVILVVLVRVYKQRLRSKQLERNEPAVHYRPDSYRSETGSTNNYTENPSFRQRKKKKVPTATLR